MLRNEEGAFALEDAERAGRPIAAAAGRDSFALAESILPVERVTGCLPLLCSYSENEELSPLEMRSGLCLFSRTVG